VVLLVMLIVICQYCRALLIAWYLGHLKNALTLIPFTGYHKCPASISSHEDLWWCPWVINSYIRVCDYANGTWPCRNFLQGYATDQNFYFGTQHTYVTMYVRMRRNQIILQVWKFSYFNFLYSYEFCKIRHFYYVLWRIEYHGNSINYCALLHSTQ